MRRWLTLPVLLFAGFPVLSVAIEEPVEKISAAEISVILSEEDREVVKHLELLEMLELLSDLEHVTVLEDDQ
jgi:flavoprotein